MKEHKVLNVCIGDRKVGTLATTAAHFVAFEYDAEWPQDGFSISPISLPLQLVEVKTTETFEKCCK